MRRSTTVAVMIPAYNEEASIAEVIQRIPRRFSNCRVKVLVVDDGSIDDTVAIARQYADYCVSLGRRVGLAKAFAIGLSKALELGSEIVVNIDADGQYDPEEIPNIAKPILTGKADIVLGSRFLGWIEEMPLRKKLANRIASLLTAHLAGISISDAQTGLRGFSREAAMRLTVLGDYTYTQETIIQAAKKNLKIVEVPVNFRKRKHGESRLVRSLMSYAGRTGLTMFRTYRDYRPLATFLTIGLVLFAAGILVGFRVLLHFAQTGQVTPFIPSAILTAVLVILGFQVMFLALVADMLGSIHTLLEESIYFLRSERLNKSSRPR
jgi:glycosyltransferase involved in cell wall biosynthesis